MRTLERSYRVFCLFAVRYTHVLMYSSCTILYFYYSGLSSLPSTGALYSVRPFAQHTTTNYSRGSHQIISLLRYGVAGMQRQHSLLPLFFLRKHSGGSARILMVLQSTTATGKSPRPQSEVMDDYSGEGLDGISTR